MESSVKRTTAGQWIRELRERRMVKTRDIERITQGIAETEGSSDFYISHSTLAGIEAGSIPTIHKLYSLAVALRVTLGELLLPFGIDLVAPQRFGVDAENQELAFRFQLNFDTNVTNEETTMLNGLPYHRYRFALPVLGENQPFFADWSQPVPSVAKFGEPTEISFVGCGSPAHFART